MNLYRVRARFKCAGFTCSVFEHLRAHTAAQAIKKAVDKFTRAETLPAFDQLTFISAFLVRKLEDES